MKGNEVIGIFFSFLFIISGFGVFFTAPFQIYIKLMIVCIISFISMMVIALKEEEKITNGK